MPKKIQFRVVYCTGWEDDYPPKDLEVSWRELRVTHLFTIALHLGTQSIHQGMEISKVVRSILALHELVIVY